ncbi:MAG: hypothetical protein ACLUFL_03475 [Flavonifractor plautii]
MPRIEKLFHTHCRPGKGVKPETSYRREVRQIALPNDHSDHTRYNNGRDKASLGNEFNEFAFTAKFRPCQTHWKTAGTDPAHSQWTRKWDLKKPAAAFQRLKAVLATTGGKAGAYE